MGKDLKKTKSIDKSYSSTTITSKQPKPSKPIKKSTNHVKTKKARKKSQKSSKKLSQSLSSASNLPIICAILGILMVCLNMHIEQRIWRRTVVSDSDDDVKPRYSLANPDPNYQPEKFDKLTNTYRRSIFTGGDLMNDNLGNTTTTPPFVKSTTVSTRRTTPNPSSLLGSAKLAPEKSVCTFGTDL